MIKTFDVLVVGSGGIAGVYTALNLNSNLNILLICKEGLKDCNFYLALKEEYHLLLILMIFHLI